MRRTHTCVRVQRHNRTANAHTLVRANACAAPRTRLLTPASLRRNVQDALSADKLPDVLANLLLLRESLCNDVHRPYWITAVGSATRDALWSSSGAQGISSLHVSPEDLLDEVRNVRAKCGGGLHGGLG